MRWQWLPQNGQHGVGEGEVGCVALIIVGTVRSGGVGHGGRDLLQPQQQESKARTADLHFAQCFLHLNTGRVRAVR